MTVNLNILSLIILCIIQVNSRKRSDNNLTRNRLFSGLVLILAILLVVDIGGRAFDKHPSQVFWYVNMGFNILLYLLGPIQPMVWVLYAEYQLNRDEKRLRTLTWALLAVVLLNAALTVLTIFTGWYFYIDGQNSYHRGFLYPVHALLCFGMLAYSFVLILINRNKVSRMHYLTLLFFMLPPVIGATLQSLFYGLALNWSCTTLSVMLVYFNIQDQRLDTDYLTGTYNRQLLDNVMREKIQMAQAKKTFSAILFDLDNFKRINDTHGHLAGDEALLLATGLMKSCLRNNDFVSRYGGDEFLVLLDIDRPEILEETVKRINICFHQFNSSNAKPYQLSLSAGYAVYDATGKMTAEQFIKHIDALMYAEKKRVAKIPRQ